MMPADAIDIVKSAYRNYRTVNTRRGRLAYTDVGEGYPLVLVHGIPLSLLTWRKLAPLLAMEFRVIAIDMLGYGLSDKPTIEYEVSILSSSISEACKVLGLQEAGFVGHSFGAGVVLRVAMDSPTLVRRMVLISSVNYDCSAQSVNQLMRHSVVRRITAMTLRADFVGFRLFLSKLNDSYCHSSRQEETIGRAYYALMRQNGGEKSYVSTLAHFKEATFTLLIPRIHQTTLLISGESDTVIPTQNMLRMCKEMSCANLHVLERTGHLAQEEEPVQVAELVATFMRE